MPRGYLWPSLHSSSAIPHQLSILPNSEVSLVDLSAEVKLLPWFTLSLKIAHSILPSTVRKENIITVMSLWQSLHDTPLTTSQHLVLLLFCLQQDQLQLCSHFLPRLHLNIPRSSQRLRSYASCSQCSPHMTIQFVSVSWCLCLQFFCRNRILVSHLAPASQRLGGEGKYQHTLLQRWSFYTGIQAVSQNLWLNSFIRIPWEQIFTLSLTGQCVSLSVLCSFLPLC